MYIWYDVILFIIIIIIIELKVCHIFKVGVDINLFLSNKDFLIEKDDDDDDDDDDYYCYYYYYYEST